MGSNELKKTLGVSAALSTVVGSVIGAGVFFKPQAVYTLTGGAIYNLVAVTLGNIVGGALFMGLGTYILGKEKLN